MADNHFEVSDDFSSLEKQIPKEEIELLSEKIYKTLLSMTGKDQEEIS